MVSEGPAGTLKVHSEVFAYVAYASVLFNFTTHSHQVARLGDAPPANHPGSSERECWMSTKLLLALLVSVPFIISGVAVADPPTTRCAAKEEFTTPGGFNKVENEEHGTPGNQIGTKKEPILPTDEFAQDRNEARFTEDCPPPGQTNP